MGTDSPMDEWMRAGARRQRRWKLAAAIAIGVAIVIGVIVMVMVDLTPVGERRAIHAIEAAGMRDVLLGGVDLFACDGDEASRHFAATNVLGKRVEGTVCCGLTAIAKACTLRWADPR